MGDLISKSALIEALEKEEKIYKDNQTYPSFYTAKAVIRHQPSVESHNGQWVQMTDFDADNNAIFECSNCFHSDTQAKGVEVPFCWYCGARMKGK